MLLRTTPCARYEEPEPALRMGEPVLRLSSDSTRSTCPPGGRQTVSTETRKPSAPATHVREPKTVQHRTCIQRARYLVLRSVTASKRCRRFSRLTPRDTNPPSTTIQPAERLESKRDQAEGF